MPLPLPNLDDRTFEELLREAERRIRQSAPAWTDLSPNDPGMVLLELFAHLTEVMLYRLNRLPEKAYTAFLRLLGVNLHPPAAAGARLRLSLSQAASGPVEVPRGTRVTVSRSDGGAKPPVFITSRAVTIQAGETEAEVLAYHCEQVEAELAGIGTSLAGLSVSAGRPPIIAPTGDEMDLIVGVEAAPGELDERVPTIRYRDKTYRIWREVDSFTNLGADRFVYVADRMDGVITFAPATRLMQEDGTLAEAPRALAEIPAAGREIRLWYRRGGGPEGNVAAHTLTVLKDPLPGLEVTNPEPATGGQAAESLENALTRGPQELHSLHRAVTARDFELVALHSARSVARAQAITQAALWRHAAPGTVEVLLVPDVPEQERSGGRVPASALVSRQTETTGAQIQRALDERRPLGTHCLVSWTRYKTVRVTARIVVRREENRAAIRQRVTERLHQTITPLPTPYSRAGWPFGQALRASHVFDIALREPGVLWIDQVRLLVDEVPERDVRSLTADAFQPSTWYAGSGSTLFRSLNDGAGWEPAAHFDTPIERVRTHPERPGLLAAVRRMQEGSGAHIHFSTDCGESWEDATHVLAFGVNDIAWLLREDTPVLLLATDKGLYELAYGTGAGPVQVLVDQQNQDLGFYAVAAAQDVRGRGHMSVAVAAQGAEGVYLSSEGGRSKTFQQIGPPEKDIRVLAVQYDGPHAYLWAGVAAYGGDAGEGCFRWTLLGAEHPPEGWKPYGDGWKGGSCLSLAFSGTRAVAGTHSAGVLYLEAGARKPRWEAPDVRSGLPLRRDTGRFLPVETVATDPGGRLVMAGSADGIYRSDIEAVFGGKKEDPIYEPLSSRAFTEKVTLPPNWLFCSGEHEIDVEAEDEAERD